MNKVVNIVANIQSISAYGFSEQGRQRFIGPLQDQTPVGQLEYDGRYWTLKNLTDDQEPRLCSTLEYSVWSLEELHSNRATVYLEKAGQNLSVHLFDPLPDFAD